MRVLKVRLADDLALRTTTSAVLMAVTLCALTRGAWAIILLGLVLGALMVAEWMRAARAENTVLKFGGVLYIAAAGAALVALRLQPDGARLLIWLFALIWAGDIGAFLIGQLFGQYRLPASISAVKTWEGVAGGVALAGIAGTLAAPAEWPGLQRAAAGLALGMAGQMGDLLESAAKRRLGVKNMSAWLPGHGGVLDRLDSTLAVLIVVGLYMAVTPLGSAE